MDSATRHKNIKGLFVPSKPTLCILLTLAAALGGFCYKLRTEGIFSCQAQGYDAEWYLAYCEATAFADYEHGAFWFDLEPSATESARDAEVVFLGNSRMLLGFSTTTTAGWFASAAAKYYLLGFSYEVRYHFLQGLLPKIEPQARVFVINLDSFFEQSDSAYASAVMLDPEARDRYERKRLWQFAHRSICGAVPATCANEYVVFRSRKTGAWIVDATRRAAEPVSYDPTTDQPEADRQVVSGAEFLSGLPVRRECVIFTIVPYVGTRTKTPREIANALGISLVAPEPQGLTTYDGVHLDSPSAELWSKAFYEEAGPQIRECLDNPSWARGSDEAAIPPQNDEAQASRVGKANSQS